MSEEILRQQIKDEEHLRLLSLGYIVSAGITAFYSLFALMYIFFGIMISISLSHETSGPDELPPELFGWIFAGFGLFFLVLGLTFAVLQWLAYVRIKQRRSLLFCEIVAGLTCLGIPYGTLLGVSTFIVLSRPSVKELFNNSG